MILVKAGAPVDATISQLIPLLEKGDIIIDGGNEWYENTEARKDKVAEHGLLYMGMGVSGGEEGARNGEPWECLHTPASAASGGTPGGNGELGLHLQSFRAKVAKRKLLCKEGGRVGYS